jgi:hypothetical protein
MRRRRRVRAAAGAGPGATSPGLSRTRALTQPAVRGELCPEAAVAGPGAAQRAPPPGGRSPVVLLRGRPVSGRRLPGVVKDRSFAPKVSVRNVAARFQ